MFNPDHISSGAVGHLFEVNTLLVVKVPRVVDCPYFLHESDIYDEIQNIATNTHLSYKASIVARMPISCLAAAVALSKHV
jgi:hypothetical protein